MQRLEAGDAFRQVAHGRRPAKVQQQQRDHGPVEEAPQDKPIAALAIGVAASSRAGRYSRHVSVGGRFHAEVGGSCASGGTVVTEGISLAALLSTGGAACAETMPKPRQNIRKARRNKAQAARMPEIIKEVTSLESRLEYIRARAADSFK